MAAKINNRCPHLKGGMTKYIKYQHGNVIVLPILGTKSKVMLCEECYRAVRDGESVEVAVQMRQPIRLCSMARGEERALFPAVVLNMPPILL